MNVYVELTHAFNVGGLRAILSSGQAVVLHKIAVMSKDGDWIVRETDEAVGHIRGVLADCGARYRFGAPFDIRWMAGGWSAHFEFRQDQLRIRADFVTRPPRLSPARVAALWREHKEDKVPFVGVRDLVDLKKTNREKDYAVIGELARLLSDPGDELLASRSARDIIRLAEEHTGLIAKLVARRPVLAVAREGLGKLESALDDERRTLIHANEARLSAYMEAAEQWVASWPAVERDVAGMPLRAAHELVVSRAEGVLPFTVERGIRE
jgi:hypothetical protein